jgi:ParB family chromosome partitioning protein
MANKVSLGMGLDGLIPVGLDVQQVAEPGESIRLIDVTKIHPNPEQPRKDFDEAALLELSNSIKNHGIIQPLVVTPANTEKTQYRIVAGERRWRASKLAGLTQVPVIIRNHKELEELEIALVENVQRVDLSPFEQALSIVKLRDQFSLTSKEIAKKLGKAEPTISNTMRLLQLPKDAIEALKQGTITEGHARAILSLKFSPELQEGLLQEITAKKLSVREAELFATNAKKSQINSEQKSSSLTAGVNKRVEEITKKGWNVSVKHKKSGGTITLAYKNETELNSILDRF